MKSGVAGGASSAKLRHGDLEEGISRLSDQPWQSLGGGKCLVLGGNRRGAHIAGVE